MAIRDYMYDSRIETDGVGIDRLVDRVAHALNRLPDAARATVLQEASRAAAKAGARFAKIPNVQFRDRTGALRKSIRVQAKNVRGIKYFNVIAGGPGAGHAILLDQGTEYRYTRERRGHGGGRDSLGRSRGRGDVTRGAQFRGFVDRHYILIDPILDNWASIRKSVIQSARAQVDDLAKDARKGTKLKPT